MRELAGAKNGALTNLSEYVLTSGDGVVAAVAEGRYLLVDVDQQGSRLYMVLFRGQDPTERLSLSHTRIAQGHLFLGPMSSLISNRRGVLARICEDDVRSHDILNSSRCSVSFPPEVVDVLEDQGAPEWSLPDGVDFFTSVKVGSDGTLQTDPFGAQPGDRLAMLMAVDVLCAVVLREGAVRLSILDRMVPGRATQA